MPRALQPYRLVLDVGTTTLKAIAFDVHNEILGRANIQLTKTHPNHGWTEQDPHAFIRLAIRALREAVHDHQLDPVACLSLGITNQRETTIVWNAESGQTMGPAIVWEDHRTATWCAQHRELNTLIEHKTGLSLEPYFSASKLRWILDHLPAYAPPLTHLRFGTLDSWLLWNLCDGRPHLTDETNAARTLFFNITTRRWDHELLHAFHIAPHLLPHVLPSQADFGLLRHSVLGASIPVRTVCGDQQSSLFSALSLPRTKKPVTKITFGTGTFLMQVLGTKPEHIPHLYTTLTPAPHHKMVYACEYKIERGGVQAEPLLKNPPALRTFLENLVHDVERGIALLPHQPAELIIDGGLTRDGILAEILKRRTGLNIRTLPTFDGTALGTARLLADR